MNVRTVSTLVTMGLDLPRSHPTYTWGVCDALQVRIPRVLSPGSVNGDAKLSPHSPSAYPHFIDKYSLAIHWSTQIHTHTDLFQEGNIHHVLLIHPSIHLLCPTQPLIHPIFLPMKVFTCQSPCTQVTHIQTLIFIHTFCSKKKKKPFAWFSLSLPSHPFPHSFCLQPSSCLSLTPVSVLEGANNLQGLASTHAFRNLQRIIISPAFVFPPLARELRWFTR